jgi:HK97 family phage portal protein
LKQIWASVKAFTAMRFPRAASWFFGWGDVSQRDYEREVGDGLDHNVLVSPILQIASMFPEAVLAVRREDKTGKREILRQHPMPALVMRPNKFYTGDTLWMATLLSFLTDGNAYWLKVRDNRGNVRELWYVAHWTMTPKSDDESVFITHYEYRVGGTSIRLDPADVVHFREGLDPRCPQLGFSRLKPLIKEIFTDSESSNLVSALLKNKGVPGLLITPEKDVQISPQDETATKQYVLEKTTGRHRGEPLVLGAATKVQEFGFSPAEMDLAAIRNVPEERVCAMLHWPAALAGFGTGIDQTKVGATMKELVKLGWTGCLLPLQRKLAAQLTFALLPDFDDEPGIEAMFDTSDVEALRADMLQMAQIGKTIMRGGFGTRADAAGFSISRSETRTRSSTSRSARPRSGATTARSRPRAIRSSFRRPASGPRA